MAFLIGGANSSAADTGYDIDNSCRFIDSSYLTRDNTTQSGAGDNFTFSAWLKMSTYGDGGYQGIFSIFKDSNDYFEVYKDNGNGTGTGSENLQIQQQINGTSVYYQIQHFEFADYSAWYHLVINFNNSESNEVDKVSIYVNGTEIQGAVSNSNPFDDVGLGDSAYDTRIGANTGWWESTGTWNGYMADVHLIAGSTLTASSFGETDEDSGIWKPKDAKDDLTFGANGFYLEFKGTGTNQDSSGIGADTSGEDNHLAVTNLAATNQTTDTPTNNFCTLNPLTKRPTANGTIAEGNLQYTASTSDSSIFGTMGIPPGMKVYFEVKLVQNTAQNGVGIHSSYDCGDGAYAKTDNEAGTYSYKPRGASTVQQYFNDGSSSDTATNNAANDTILGVAIDNENGQIHYHLDGVYINSSDPTDNDPVALVTGFGGANEQYLHFSLDTSGATEPINQYNFGNPVHSISSSQSDDNGYGNFEFDVPAGYYALCTKNLAEFG